MYQIGFNIDWMKIKKKSHYIGPFLGIVKVGHPTHKNLTLKHFIENRNTNIRIKYLFQI